MYFGGECDLITHEEGCDRFTVEGYLMPHMM